MIANKKKHKHKLKNRYEEKLIYIIYNLSFERSIHLECQKLSQQRDSTYMKGRLLCMPSSRPALILIHTQHTFGTSPPPKSY